MRMRIRTTCRGGRPGGFDGSSHIRSRKLRLGQLSPFSVRRHKARVRARADVADGRGLDVLEGHCSQASGPRTLDGRSGNAGN